MDYIRPTTITDALLQSSNVPENDTTTHGEWVVGTTYHVLDTVLDTASGVHKIYRSIQEGAGHDPPTDLLLATPLWWALVSATNRWKSFDNKVGDQTSQTTSFNFVLKPGLIDSIALLNLDATGVQIVMADQNTNLVTNGTAWTGAAGVTPPNSWNLVGHPSDFTIDTTALKITADAVNEGISQTVVVVPGTVMQLLGIYKNTTGDLAQYAVNDMTNGGADIVARVDLPTSTVNSTLSSIFTVPAGCISLKISLLAKASGDIVWFDTVSLSDVVYNVTTDLLSTIAVVDFYTYFFEPIVRAIDVLKTDLAAIGVPPYLNATIFIEVTYTAGTAKCGEIVVGLKSEIGRLKAQTPPAVSINDYSTKTGTAGNYTVHEGAYSKKLSCELLIKNTIVDEIIRQFSVYRATALVFVGKSTYTCLIVYGYIKSFNNVMPFPDYSICALEIEGLT